MFHDAKVVTENPRKCCMLITKLLHLVTQGDELSSNEVTEVFFGVTKLFQSNDMNLRRCVVSPSSPLVHSPSPSPAGVRPVRHGRL